MFADKFADTRCFWARVGGWSGASLASAAPASSIYRKVAHLGRESAGVADMLADNRCFWARAGGWSGSVGGWQSSIA